MKYKTYPRGQISSWLDPPQPIDLPNPGTDDGSQSFCNDNESVDGHKEPTCSHGIIQDLANGQ